MSSMQVLVHPRYFAPLIPSISETHISIRDLGEVLDDKLVISEKRSELKSNITILSLDRYHPGDLLLNKYFITPTK